MEFWVQRPLFDAPRERTGRTGKTRRIHEVTTLAPATPRVDHTRVTRDPEVARSHGESTRLASDLRVGLARVLDNVPPEERNRIRQMLAGSGRDAA